jgi:hypothetical protein
MDPLGWLKASDRAVQSLEGIRDARVSGLEQFRHRQKKYSHPWGLQEIWEMRITGSHVARCWFLQMSSKESKADVCMRMNQICPAIDNY